MTDVNRDVGRFKNSTAEARFLHLSFDIQQTAWLFKALE
jgi:hypothetical protein